MIEELKPCPFCGGSVGIERSGTACAIVCLAPSKCLKSGLLIGFSPDEEAEAIAAWNTRALADALAAAAKTALNFIENTEGELGITLGSGNELRAALAAWEGRK